MARLLCIVFCVADLACVPHAQPNRSPLASFEQRDVAVDIALERQLDGRASLVATFTPVRSGFHLYGKDLPQAGLRDIGRPTLLALVSSDSLISTGPLAADRSVTDLSVPTLGLHFPVYPAGAVALRLPVSVGKRPATAELSVTYMACSETVCLPPVVDRRIAVTIPED